MGGDRRAGPIWAFGFCLRDEKPLRGLEQRRDGTCLVLAGPRDVVLTAGNGAPGKRRGGHGGGSVVGRGRYQHIL